MLFCCWLFERHTKLLSWWITNVYYQLSAVISNPNDQPLTASALVHAINPQELAYQYQSASSNPNSNSKPTQTTQICLSIKLPWLQGFGLEFYSKTCFTAFTARHVTVAYSLLYMQSPDNETIVFLIMLIALLTAQTPNNTWKLTVTITADTDLSQINLLTGRFVTE